MDIKALKRAAAKVGATVENDSSGNWICYQVVAPDGMWWRESYGPHLAISTARGEKAWLVDAIKDGIERIESGLIEAEE